MALGLCVCVCIAHKHELDREQTSLDKQIEPVALPTDRFFRYFSYFTTVLGSVSSKILSSTQGARVHAALHTPDVLGALGIGCDSVLQRCCLHRCSVAARVPAAAIYKCPHATNVSSFYVYISVMCILTDRHAGCSQAEHRQHLSSYILVA